MKPTIPFSVSFVIFKIVLLSIILFFFSEYSIAQKSQLPVKQTLDSDWLLTNSKNGDKFKAIIPNEVHRVLYENKAIPDPFFGDNEANLQWIGEQEWIFSSDFIVDPKILDCDQIEIHFPGLDTYCQIWLNDKLLSNTDNAFRTYNFPVKKLLKKGNNTLKLRFFPIDSIEKEKAKAYPFRFPEQRCFSRKAPYQSGWDWGPVYKTMGITEKIELFGWKNPIFRNISVLTANIEAKQAVLLLVGEIESPEQQIVTIDISVDSVSFLKSEIVLTKGLNDISIPVNIPQPRLWWPNGAGKQELYRFVVSISEKDQIIDKQSVVTGIQMVELVDKPDKQGRAFFFKVNGLPLFIKGSNYVPMDNFVTRINHDRNLKLLQDAASVNMNMLRVWGGGVYPDNDFFEICDSLGLLVWQDFMFAGSMYPFDNDFYTNVEQEAREQIIRLRSHPSLALWCGNNEVDEGFHNWKWEQSLNWTDADSVAIWNGYLELFEKRIPAIVSKLDPKRAYWPSSPSIGWGRSESMTQGDSHYWGVWWGEQPFEKYEEKVGRFMSEFGFQGMPSMETIASFTDANSLSLDDPILQAHQKNARGKLLIDKYMEAEYPVPEKLDEYVYVSQLLQAGGITKAIEAQRRKMPYCMGTLYWQLNDSWPSISWSSIDYFGRWKALHYRLKDAFADVMISFEKDEDSLKIFVISDLKRGIVGNLRLSMFSFTGDSLGYLLKNQVIHPHTSEMVLKGPMSFFNQMAPPERSFLLFELLEKEKVIASKVYFFNQPKDLQLDNIEPVIQSVNTDNGVLITVSSNSLLKDLMLRSNDTEGRFEENFIVILPGKERAILFHPSGKIAVDDLVFSSISLNKIK
jgi:beta-mannosidase